MKIPKTSDMIVLYDYDNSITIYDVILSEDMTLILTTYLSSGEFSLEKFFEKKYEHQLKNAIMRHFSNGEEVT